jgi:hypothetical protein
MARRWITRGGPNAWPPRSPDLTPLDFSCGGYVKNIIWIFVVPPREPTLKFIEKVIYSETKF